MMRNFNERICSEPRLWLIFATPLSEMIYDYLVPRYDDIYTWVLRKNLGT